MFVTHLNKCEAVDVTPVEMKEKGQVTVRWLLGEPEGAPGFEMRLFSLTGPVATDWHTHDWEHQVFVTSGEGKIRLEGEMVKLVPGSAVLVPPDEKHQFISGSDRFEFICVVPRGTRTCGPAIPGES